MWYTCTGTRPRPLPYGTHAPTPCACPPLPAPLLPLQVHKFLTGMAPVNSIVKAGSAVASLVNAQLGNGSSRGWGARDKDGWGGQDGHSKLVRQVRTVYVR